MTGGIGRGRVSCTVTCLSVWALGSLGVLLHLGFSQPLGAQEVIPNGITCPDCTIELVETQRVGDVHGQELFDDVNRWIVRDPAGRLWVPNLSLSDVIQVYEADGSFEEFSRKGAGPGEFAGVEMMACTGDAFLMVDSRARYSRIDPISRTVTTLATSTDIGLRRPMAFLPMSDTAVWISSPSRHPDFIGYPVSIANPLTDKTYNAFGKKVDHNDRMVERHMQRFLAQLSDRRVVSVHRFSYEIEVYAHDGRPRRQDSCRMS